MNYNLKTLRGDIFGGVTSTVVALPFALSFGVASGMGAAAGLYGAIAVGFFTALFGGTRTVISGPASSMTVAMAVIVTTHATNLNEALVIVVLGGLLQVLLGVLWLDGAPTIGRMPTGLPGFNRVCPPQASWREPCNRR